MDREQEVWACLAPVTDPELDESVTELGFVKSVVVEESDVKILFHLPTFWCAANFAYMMASDMHRAVKALPWVRMVDVELLEHMYADTINRGIKANLSFKDTFGTEASGEIDTVRASFRKKAFQQRQELLLRQLLAHGISKSTLVNMQIGDLLTLMSESFNQNADRDGGESRVLQRYIEIRQEWGGLADASSLAMVTVDGSQLNEEQFDEYLQELRSTRINTQFNGEICRGLLRARYGTDQASPIASSIEVKVKFHPLADLQSTQ